MSASDESEDSYCTHKCLLGVKNSGKADSKCPNFSSHEIDKDGFHLIIPKEMLNSTQDILRKKRVNPALEDAVEFDDVASSGIEIHRVVLPEGNYKFIVKSANELCWKQIRHEKAVYKRIERLQGDVVPVCIGTFPERPNGNHRSHMLLSYAGVTFDPISSGKPNNQPLVRQAVDKLHSFNVKHGDLAARNLTYSKHSGKVFLIDFERSQIVKDGVRKGGPLKKEAGESFVHFGMRKLIEKEFKDEADFADGADKGLSSSDSLLL